MTTTAPARDRVLMEGSEALARAAIVAGCRFFAGYPMTPFTEVLEHFARLLPDEGGVCINAESELEAVGMAWGALATGARAATGSTGQGLSLMQESFSEITLAELPLVVFNMARGQQDYYQATRGRRSRRLPPHRARTARRVGRCRARAARVPPRRQVAQPGADLRRLPPRAHAGGAVDRTVGVPRPACRRTGRSTGRVSGSGASRAVTPLGVSKVGQRALGQEGKAQYIATKLPLMEREVRVETGFLDDAETVIVAFGVAGQVREVRDRTAARRRTQVRLRPSDHAVAVPVRSDRGSRVRAERSAHRQLRAVGRPDGRRRAHRSGGQGARRVHRRRVDRPLGLRRRPHPRRRGDRRAAARAARRTRAAGDPRLRGQQLRAAAAPSGGDADDHHSLRSGP